MTVRAMARILAIGTKRIMTVFLHYESPVLTVISAEEGDVLCMSLSGETEGTKGYYKEYEF